MSDTRSLDTTPLVAGSASGPVVVLDEPLSFWGGFDPTTGEVVEQGHAQHGVVLAGAVVAMQRGKGSSSGSSVLAEAIRRGTAPSAIVLGEVDEIICLGAIVGDELYATAMPVVLVDEPCHLLSSARRASVGDDGTLRWAPGTEVGEP